MQNPIHLRCIIHKVVRQKPMCRSHILCNCSCTYLVSPLWHCTETSYLANALCRKSSPVNLCHTPLLCHSTMYILLQLMRGWCEYFTHFQRTMIPKASHCLSCFKSLGMHPTQIQGDPNHNYYPNTRWCERNKSTYPKYNVD